MFPRSKLFIISKNYQALNKPQILDLVPLLENDFGIKYNFHLAFIAWLL